MSFPDDALCNSEIKYDSISAGATGRDFKSMTEALNELETHSLIVSPELNFSYDYKHIKVISGDNQNHYALSYNDLYKYYSQSKFICIPATVKFGRNSKVLNGLNSFVDATVMHKPVLISDNTNMGIDVERLGIGFKYKAGDVKDMRDKMKIMLSMSDNKYTEMSHNMEMYSLDHNYKVFCKELLDIISHN